MVSVGNPPEEMDRYLDAMRKEVRIYKDLLGGRLFPRHPFSSAGDALDALPGPDGGFLRDVAEDFDLGNCRQITCETEPTTILGDEGRKKLRAMKHGGVNRISLGVQSFDDGILKSTGRLHSSQDARDAVLAIRKAGFESVSIDLIYGYPGSTLKKWEKTLMTAAAARRRCLSAVPFADRSPRGENGIHQEDVRRLSRTLPLAGGDLPDEGTGGVDLRPNGYRETSRRVFCRGPEHNSEYLQDHTDRLSNVLGSASPRGTTSRIASSSTRGRASRTIIPPSTGAAACRARKIKSGDDVRRWAICVSLKHRGVSHKQYEAVTGTPLAGNSAARSSD